MTRFLMFLILGVPMLAGSISCGAAHGHEGEGDTIIIHGHDRGGFLGVSTQDMTPSLAEAMKTSTKSGAIVKEVVAGSPAEKAGIKENDIIVEFNGNAIEDRWDLLEEVRSSKPGTNATLVVVRGDRRETLSATVGKESASARRLFVPSVPDVPARPRVLRMPFNSFYGLSLMDLGEQLAAFFEAPNGHGVLVEEVEEKSPAAEAGFKAGDVVIRIGKESVEDIGDVWSALEDVKEGEKAEVEVIRKGSRQTLTLTANDKWQGRWEGRRHWTPWHFRGPWRGWNSEAFERSMEEFGKRMEEFGKNLEEKMKDVEKRIQEELRFIEV